MQKHPALLKKVKARFSPLFICLFSFCAFQSTAQLSEKNYKIYSTISNKEVSIADIVLEMKSNDVLFFGEEHNDSVAHYLEAAIFEAMHKAYGSNLALSMEMFDRDVQTVMNEYLQGSIREKHFVKDARVWSNYRDYKPMVEYAKTNNLHVICANAASRYTNLAGRAGQQALMQLPAESKAFFAPLPYDTASGKYYDKLIQISTHMAPAPADSSAPKPAPSSYMGGFNLIMGQSLWDATMAYSISQHLKKNKDKKVFQVNGRFHSDEGYAIVTQLKKYHPKLKSLIISTGSDEAFPAIDWSQYTHLGDFIIITDPAVPKTYDE